MAPVMIRRMTLWKSVLHRQRTRGALLSLLAIALAGPVATLPPPARAATAGAGLNVSVAIAPSLVVEGEGVAGSETETVSALSTDGAPFRIRVRSNAPWRWSVRMENATGVPPPPLRCNYAYRGVQTFGGMPGGLGRLELGSVGGPAPTAPLPRGEVVLEGRVLPPPAADPLVAWQATLVWTISLESGTDPRPLTRTITTRLRGGPASDAAPPSR
jgi:hypothetical protein